MRYYSTLLVLTLCYGSFSACAALAEPSREKSSSQATSEGLARAIARNDRGSALELALPVLEDEAGDTYRFDYEARWNAANAIRDLRLTETIPLLRKVAGRSYSSPRPEPTGPEESQRDLLKIFAIKSALSGLTLLGDPEAAMLNRQHVASPVIASTAIRNLKQLEDWEATEQIRRTLEEREHTREAFLDLSAALDFLAASPLSKTEDCALLQRLKTTYASCFDAGSRPPGIAGCEDFVRAARAFEARLQC
jgi:hypothetical protein